MSPKCSSNRELALDPNLHHAMLQWSSMYYFRYAQKLLESVSALLPSSAPPALASSRPPPSNTPPPLPPSQLSWTEEELDKLDCLVEEEWRQVGVYFVLRQALAPCVETMILLDRKLHLLEKGKGSTDTKTTSIRKNFSSGHRKVSLLQIFSSKISPRNIVLLAR